MLQVLHVTKLKSLNGYAGTQVFTVYAVAFEADHGERGIVSGAVSFKYH